MSPSSVFRVTMPLAASIFVTSPVILCWPRWPAAALSADFFAAPFAGSALPAAPGAGLPVSGLLVAPLGAVDLVVSVLELPELGLLELGAGALGADEPLEGCCVPCASAAPARPSTNTSVMQSVRTCRIGRTSCGVYGRVIPVGLA